MSSDNTLEQQQQFRKIKMVTKKKTSVIVSSRKQVFNSNYQDLMVYVNEKDLSNFPGKCKNARRLSNWLHRQYKRDLARIPEDERVKLDTLRVYFDDKPRREKEDKCWNQFLHDLEKYKEEYHTFVISQKDDVNKNLYNWASRQRKLARANTLRPERRVKLIEIGFL